MGIAYPRLKLDIAAEVEPVGNILQILEDRLLTRLCLGPVPLLHEILGERVAVEGAARTIDPRSRVAVPPPRAAHASSAVVDADREAHRAQVVQGVQAANTRSDDHYVIVFDRSVSFGLLWVLSHICHGVPSFTVLRRFFRSLRYLSYR